MQEVGTWFATFCPPGIRSQSSRTSIVLNSCNRLLPPADVRLLQWEAQNFWFGRSVRESRPPRKQLSQASQPMRLRRRRTREWRASPASQWQPCGTWRELHALPVPPASWAPPAWSRDPSRTTRGAPIRARCPHSQHWSLHRRAQQELLYAERRGRRRAARG